MRDLTGRVQSTILNRFTLARAVFLASFWIIHMHPKNCSKDGELKTFGAVLSGLLGDI